MSVFTCQRGLLFSRFIRLFVVVSSSPLADTMFSFTLNLTIRFTGASGIFFPRANDMVPFAVL
jgi:hypothetical protein